MQSTVDAIAEETEKLLRKMELWENPDAWSPALMRHLARGTDVDQNKYSSLLTFEQVMLAVKKVTPDRVAQFMNEYALALESHSHIQDAFEYAVAFQQVDILKQLLEQHKSNVYLEEWTTVYRLLLEVIQRKLSYKGVISKARDLVGHVESEVLKVRLELLEVHAHEQLGCLENTISLVDHMPGKLVKIEPSFMKSVLLSRASLSMGTGLLRVKGDFKKAREVFTEVVDNPATPEAMLAPALHGLGLATLCGLDRKEALPHYEQAIFYAKKAGLVAYAERLENEYYPFARNICGEQFDLTGIAPCEQVHQYIVRCEVDKALEMISQLEAEGNQSACLTWYRGIATGKEAVLWEALDRFEVENQSYLRPFVKQEIQFPRFG
ncbi:AimR family lysis-lysogeny pheromone receptor [Shouchella lonarensis]|uniref:Tetratricopeptide repeat-containing protein n=1 Tax=Shouchella lonarensis TaxID=1464122 RepID=A0A1G6HMX0_9BACI|nr:AimR family lysis-lysogeny pheromone receptor [Shouchella lonarensis]SDB95544.1 hypothetical protein SAMN05421737_10483 [Shouchella lonarensis]